jgi:hypothetical protein
VDDFIGIQKQVGFGVVVLPIVFDCMIFSFLLFSKRKSRAKSLIIEWLLPLCNQGSF